MPSIRLIPIVLVCLAPLIARAQVPPPDQATPPPTQTPAPAATPAPPAVAVPEQPPAEARLDFATVQLRELKQIAAKIDMTVDMLNQKFSLVGNYYKSPTNKVRLQLSLEGLGDTNAKMLQVSDGKILWDFQQVLGMQSCHKREIEPILKKLDDPNLSAGFRIAIISNMGFGGPEAMLSGLRKSVAFDQMSPDKLDGIDVVVLRGTWRDRATLLGPNERALPPTAPLPPYVPENVAIYLSLDGWPHMIELIGRASTLLQEDIREIDKATGRPIGPARKAAKVDPTRVTLRYKLLPNTEIVAGLFTFEPPASVAATSIIDDTEAFLASLDQYIALEVNRKKAEAAKAEGEQPLLKAPPIELPSGSVGEVPAPK